MGKTKPKVQLCKYTNITWEIAEKLRKAVERGESQISIATRMGLSRTTVWEVVNSDRPKYRPPLSEEAIENIRDAREELGVDAVAEKLGLSKFIVSRI
jgi:predicted DNA-binding protein (UPF0251 family)